MECSFLNSFDVVMFWEGKMENGRAILLHWSNGGTVKINNVGRRDSGPAK